MSSDSFRSAARGTATRPIASVTDLTRELLGLAAETGAAFASGALGVAQRSTGIRVPRPRRACECGCECEDEPEERGCRCDVRVSAYPGERVRIPVRVRNSMDRAVSVVPSASPWHGPGDPAERLTVEPKALQLAPGQSGVVMASGNVTEGFRTGSSYEADILLQTGERVDRVCVRLEVVAEDRAACEVDLRAPQRKHRCHTWSDHFHCERPQRPTLRVRGEA